jgi:hypothetical protein
LRISCPWSRSAFDRIRAVCRLPLMAYLEMEESGEKGTGIDRDSGKSGFSK